jgi:hypothetical protein
LPKGVTLHADANYRTSREVLRQIGLFVDVGEQVKAAGPLQGDAIDIATYANFAGLKNATIAAIGRARSAGFKSNDIAVLTSCGREGSAPMPFDRLGAHTLRRPSTGTTRLVIPRLARLNDQPVTMRHEAAFALIIVKPRPQCASRMVYEVVSIFTKADEHRFKAERQALSERSGFHASDRSRRLWRRPMGGRTEAFPVLHCLRGSSCESARRCPGGQLPGIVVEITGRVGVRLGDQLRPPGRRDLRHLVHL